jgi:hypothetical protein
MMHISHVLVLQDVKGALGAEGMPCSKSQRPGRAVETEADIGGEAHQRQRSGAHQRTQIAEGQATEVL